MDRLQTLINSLLECSDDSSKEEIISQLKNSSQNMIFHGSSVSNITIFFLVILIFIFVGVFIW